MGAVRGGSPSDYANQDQSVNNHLARRLHYSGGMYYGYGIVGLIITIILIVVLLRVLGIAI